MDFQSVLAGLMVLLLLGCFAKIFVVLSILKVGVGLEGLGLSLIVAAFSLLLSVVIMQPQLEPIGGFEGILSGKVKVDDKTLQTHFQPFLTQHADPAVISRIRTRIGGTKKQDNEKGAEQDKHLSAEHVINHSKLGPSTTANSQRDDFPILALSFFVTELREALELGLILLLPFVVIDLLVVNVLMALGITNLSARYVSLPLKLLLFVSIDGWTLIVDKLVGAY